MKKMIERYVIINAENEVVTNVEEIRSKTRMMYKPEDNILRVYDREERKSIAKMNTGDRVLNFVIGEAIVAACDEYVPPEPETEPEDDTTVDGGDDGSD